MALAENRLVAEQTISSTSQLIWKMHGNYRFHPLYGVAMLKVSFELRPGRHPGFDKILAQTLCGMQADEGELDEFVKVHRSDLERRCKEVGI